MRSAVRGILRKSFALGGSALRLFAFVLFEYLLPKKSNIWCFCTWNNSYPHTIDNPRGLFEEIKHDSALRKIILLKTYHKADPTISEGVNVTFVNVESIKGAYLLARSKIVVLGYGL